MKIKKIYRKIICTVLAGLLPVSVSLPVFAADNTMLEGDISQDIEILYGQDSAYMVTVPKKIILGMDRKATYAIKVSGDIRSDQYVRVAPVDEIPETDIVDFYMKDQNGKKEDVVATVIQNKICWNFDDAANAYEEANNLVSAPGLTAGTWKGTLQLDIILETEETHVHDYVNGKCVCGAVDPEHTHIYENGTCTMWGGWKQYGSHRQCKNEYRNEKRT